MQPEKNQNNKATNNIPKGVSKALMVVALRNKFFYIFYRYASIVFLSSLLVLLSSLVFLGFFIQKPIKPQYIVTNEDGTFFELSPLSECKPDANVQRFVTNTMEKLFKYDFINYATQIQSAAEYFTATGWNAYLNEFKLSGTLRKVKENRLVSTITINKVPEIKRRFNLTLGGVNTCAWDVEANITTSLIGQRSSAQNMTVFFRVIRNSVINNPNGLGIQTIILQTRTTK